MSYRWAKGYSEGGRGSDWLADVGKKVGKVEHGKLALQTQDKSV